MKICLRIALCAAITAFFSFAQTAVFCEDTSELKSQVQKLQEENSELKKTVEVMLQRISALESKDEVLSNETKQIMQEYILSKTEPQKAVAEEDSDNSLGIIEPPKLNIRGFGNFGAKAEFIEGAGDTNAFSTGELDFLLTSKIAEKISLLNELVVEIEEDNTAANLELERLFVTYWLSDKFNVNVGKIQTALGYWVQAYHQHGDWLQTSITRPEIYHEGEEGGILPLHSVGIEVFGIQEFDSFDFKYRVALLNGRAKLLSENQQTRDSNNSKAVNTIFTVQPHFVEDLSLGLDVYYDTIPADPDVETRIEPIKELIRGGFVTYLHGNVELLSEIFSISHSDKTSGGKFDALGYYLQGGYKFGKFVPYYRFDTLFFEDGDPYFAEHFEQNGTDLVKHTLGLRWNLSTWNALKLEYGFGKKKNHAGERKNEHDIELNSSFIF